MQNEKQDAISVINSQIRVWDCESHMFLQPLVKHVICENGTPCRFIAYRMTRCLTTELYSLPTILEDQTRFLISRATGMRDGNNAPIFQGDIVRFPLADKGGASVTAEVFWHPDGMWSPMTILQEHLLIPVGKDGSEKYENRCSGFTVIGNKYENPQLLDDVLPRE